MTKLLVGGCLGVILLGLAGGRSIPEKIPMVASIIPLGDFCQKIGGDRVEVEVLTPPGASPHTFEPLPSVVAKVMQARVFVYVGADLDPAAERLLRTRGTQGLAVVEAVQGISLLNEVDSKPHGHQEAPNERPKPAHHRGNPHVWLDPVLAQGICRKIAAALIEVDATHRQVYEVNLERYLNELENLHRQIKECVSNFRWRRYVCFHPAFAYFARRYHLQKAGVIETSPGREPTLRHIQRIVAAIRRYRVQAVFAEPQLSTRVAEVIAHEAGVKVLMLDPLGGNPPYGSDYLRMMRYNLLIMEQAMR